MSEFKVFEKWETSDVEVKDLGLKPYINLRPIFVALTQGKLVKKQFWKSKKPIVERLMNKLLVTGHRGKKHWRSSGQNTGKKQLVYNITKKAFEIIHSNTTQNPMKILVRALENGAPREGIATIEYGGVKYPKAMDMAPQRRVDLVLRWITQGAYSAAAAAKTKKTISAALAEELIAAANNDSAHSNAIKKKTDLERQAQASR